MMTTVMTKITKQIPISFLDLVPVPEGSDAKNALKQAVTVAQTAEQVGFNRYWLAEHHNMRGIASTATSVLLAHIGAHTSKIRIGSGGIMLPNHAPLVVAEQFGTLATLYGERIDLGVGRAPGTDGATFRALRRTMNDAENFPQDVQELMHYFDPLDGQTVTAMPANGLNVPVWILGSSLFGASLAAALGLPYVFASHFAPQMLSQAVTLYRENFKPSRYLQQPYVMVASNLLLADTEEEAAYQFTSAQQSFVNLRRGKPSQMPKPIENIDAFWTSAEKYMVESSLAISFVGTSDSVKPKLDHFLETIRPDELIVTCNIYDQQTRLNSLSLVKSLDLFSLNS